MVDTPTSLAPGPRVEIAAAGDDVVVVHPQGGGDVRLAARVVAVDRDEHVRHLVGRLVAALVHGPHPVEEAVAGALKDALVVGRTTVMPDVGEWSVELVEAVAI